MVTPQSPTGAPHHDSSETGRLLQCIENSKDLAFSKLLKRHRRFLQRVIEARIHPLMMSRLDPSDVVQETQLQAIRRFDDYLRRRPLPFRLWLRKMACDQLIMLQRQHLGAAKRSRFSEIGISNRSSMSLVRPLLDKARSPSWIAARRELIDGVRGAVDDLTNGDREILLMRNVEALSNQEAADVLGIAPVAASQRYGRALRRLRALLVQRGLIEEA